MHNRLHKNVIKLAISVSLIALLVYWLDWQQTLDAMARASIVGLAIGSLLIILVIILDGIRLYWMVPVENFSFLEHISLALHSAFVMQLGFGVISGDAYRTAVYALKDGTILKPALHIFSARLAGIISLGIVAIITSLWILQIDDANYQEFGVQIIKVIIAFSFSIFVLLVLLLFAVRKKMISLPKWSVKLINALKTITPRIWAISIIMVVARGLSFTSVLYATNASGQIIPIHIPFLASMSASLSSFLPLALGGLGIREGALAGTVALFGVPFIVAMSAAILMRLVMLFASSIGLLLSLAISRRDNPLNQKQ